VRVAKLAHVTKANAAIEAEVLQKPHVPPSALPTGKMAVYVFLWDEWCLKVGKVGPRSHARYASQHYNPHSSKSNLAKSLLKHKSKLELSTLTDATVGSWIKGKRTESTSFLIKVWGSRFVPHGIISAMSLETNV
jgi:hypothetical protein